MDDIRHPVQASPEALKEKYRIEREKRLRPDGPDQYLDLSGVFQDIDRDPYVEPGFSRPPIAEETDVVIVGGGFGGMLAAARLRQQGVEDFRIVERGGDFGGTWYWNRYPGAACDIESYVYLPLLEETGYIPTEKYAGAPEIFAYCQLLGRHFDLYNRALFQTLVSEVRWDEARARWIVSTGHGDVLAARFLVIAGGVMHKAKLPGIPGIETFQGHSFHTSRWDYGFTGGSPTEPMNRLADKRVGIIGTGATAVQAVPNLARDAQHLYVFQRTPSGVGVRANRPTDPEWVKSLQPGWQQRRIENFSALVSGEPVDEDLVQDGWTAIQGGISFDGSASNDEQRQMADFARMEAIRARVDQVVRDPATAEALKPWYNTMCKRPCFHDEYLDSFNRSNVTLVDTDGKGVERITANGVVVDGVEYPVDCLVYASGFEVLTGYTRRLGFELYGRGGQALTEAWKEGAGTLHGMYARGFPNLVMFSIIQGGSGVNVVEILSEIAIQAAYTIKRMIDLDARAFEPSEAAQEKWLGELFSRLMGNASFASECTPGFYNNEGMIHDPRLARNAPFEGVSDYFKVLRGWRDNDLLEGLEVSNS
jgi:cation diffusion facilitator CzcD-associated flavoprotein CzcO